MKKHYFILIVCLASIFFSCEEKNQKSRIEKEYVNKWIYDNMSFYYLWRDNIPRQPNFELPQGMFFETLLYKRGDANGDRYSWIQENYTDLLGLLQGVTPYDVGFESILYSFSSFVLQVDYILQIAYVKPGTDAEKIGLKRGDFIVKVNDIAVNPQNQYSLFSGSEPIVKITFLDVNTGVTTDKFVQKMPNYAENPVFFNNVYEIDGHKIGYLVYNFFASGPTANDNSYDRELNRVFGYFKSEGITELVLDLRYNSGGSMNSAILLGSMIVPNLNTNEIFTQSEFNSLFQSELINSYGEEILTDKFRDRLAENDEEINNVGGTIQKLYVLTSSWTASASELVINGLKPYMDGMIFLIGGNTEGKNVGSVSIYEENNPKNKWGMQPIVLRYFNRDGTADFATGFVPDILELDNREKLPLGDTNEVMLNIAINQITGGNVLRSANVDNWLPLGSSLERKAWTNRTIVDRSLLEKLRADSDFH